MPYVIIQLFNELVGDLSIRDVGWPRADLAAAKDFAKQKLLLAHSRSSGNQIGPVSARIVDTNGHVVFICDIASVLAEKRRRRGF